MVVSCGFMHSPRHQPKLAEVGCRLSQVPCVFHAREDRESTCSSRGSSVFNRSTSKPHETTTKPVTKPLDFYHTFHETTGFYKYYLYVWETFFYRMVVSWICRQNTSGFVTGFVLVSCGFVYFPGGVQKQRILSSFVAFSVCFAQHGRK